MFVIVIVVGAVIVVVVVTVVVFCYSDCCVFVVRVLCVCAWGVD